MNENLFTSFITPVILGLPLVTLIVLFPSLLFPTSNHAHGSTVGQLNDAALFYMQQRGVSREEAKLLLQFAFINEVIDKMELEPLRDRLHHLVEKRFRGELNKCEGCKLCK